MRVGECLIAGPPYPGGRCWVAGLGDVTTPLCLESEEQARLALASRLRTLEMMLLRRLPFPVGSMDPR